MPSGAIFRNYYNDTDYHTPHKSRASFSTFKAHDAFYVSWTCCHRKPEDLMGDVRHMLNQARGDSHVSVGDAGRSLGQQHADDTAIVQNVGAPYAALQWRKEDSVNHCRCDTFTLSEII